jgi:DNA-directed RNA polymerase subunit RPC12/RpoP
MSGAKRAKCLICGTELNKIAVGLNKKLLRLDAKQYYCLTCLADYLDATIEELIAKAEEFKEQGCKQF